MFFLFFIKKRFDFIDNQCPGTTRHGEGPGVLPGGGRPVRIPAIPTYHSCCIPSTLHELPNSSDFFHQLLSQSLTAALFACFEPARFLFAGVHGCAVAGNGCCCCHHPLGHRPVPLTTPSGEQTIVVNGDMFRLLPAHVCACACLLVAGDDHHVCGACSRSTSSCG